MAGAEDKVGGWTNPSPGTFISNFMDEDFGARSFCDLLAGNGSEPPDQESDKKKSVTSSKEEDSVGIQRAGDLSYQVNSFDVQKSSLHRGLTERIAARAGFSAPKLNTTQIRSENLIPLSSETCSSYLTTPHGLDSPVFLSNFMALPSPTTGKFQFGQDKEFDDMGSESFVLKPHSESGSLYFSHVKNKGLSVGGYPQQNISVHSGHSTQTENLQSGHFNFQKQQESNQESGSDDSYHIQDVGDDIRINQKLSGSFMSNKQSPALDDQPNGVEPKGEYSAVAAGAPAEDGYNWRKYGQKQVKGSEYPRSYYKCTHPSCHVRKKVERSHEGHITEIIYRGSHDHLKPPQNRRSSVPHPSSDPNFVGSEFPGVQPGFDDKPLVAVTHNGTTGLHWRNDSLDTTSSASGAAEFCDPSSPILTPDALPVESPDAVDISSTLSNAEDEDDRATHGSVSLGGDGEEDETESKRRKLDNSNLEMSAASRAAREPRVVVQTTSEVDILDDGYRWRKYGQKVVKGNPNPRSYYKCTSQGCKVRKHVERASHDLKSVITTYEGKHNHEVPAARNSSSSHAASLSSAMSVPQSHGHHWRPEPTNDSMMKFDMRMPHRGSFGLHGREGLGSAANFGYGMPQQGFGFTGLSSMAPMKTTELPPLYSFTGGNRRAAEAGYMMQKGELKEESRQSGSAMSTEALIYSQMMGRFP